MTIRNYGAIGSIEELAEFTERVHGSRRHGLSRHPLFGTWYRLVQRCTNERDRAFPNYGGRGITVFEPWLDPAAFIAYVESELGPRPPAYSLDRVNNDAGYEPENLRWATRSEQNANQRQRICDGYPLPGTGYRGIRFIERTGRYQARIHRGGREKTVGTFATIEEAVAARAVALA